MALPRVFIITNKREQAGQLKTQLTQRGFDCLIVPNNDGAIEQIAGQSRGVMLLDMDEATTGSETWELAQRTRQEMNIPLIALISREKLNGFDFSTSLDDFVIKPWEATEVAARIKRILRQKGSIET
jgi:DNA-binding response OmpR family regulator